MADVQMYSRGNEVAGAAIVLDEARVNVVSTGGVDNLLVPKNVPIGYQFQLGNKDADTKTLLTNGTDTVEGSVVTVTQNEVATVRKTAATVFTVFSASDADA